MLLFVCGFAWNARLEFTIWRRRCPKPPHLVISIQPIEFAPYFTHFSIEKQSVLYRGHFWPTMPKSQWRLQHSYTDTIHMYTRNIHTYTQLTNLGGSYSASDYLVKQSIQFMLAMSWEGTTGPSEIARKWSAMGWTHKWGDAHTHAQKHKYANAEKTVKWREQNQHSFTAQSQLFMFT